MPDFKIINTPNEIMLSDQWVPSSKFNSKGRLVDAQGNAVSSSCQGRQYRIIEKRERILSTRERIESAFIGTLIVVCTLCLALFSKSVRNLFSKPKIIVRFGILEKETKFKVEEDKPVNIESHPLFGGTKISEGLVLNFVLVKKDGKQTLVAVTSAEFGGGYRIYKGSALEALLKLAQDKEPRFMWERGRHYGSPIGHFLKHPHNSMITEDEFFKFILEKDQTGAPRICTLNSDSTLEVLNIIKEKNISINLNDKTSEGKTLFTFWAGTGNPKITELILELDSSVIEQTQYLLFMKAALKGSKKEADILINAMEKKNMILSLEEEWIKRAFKNDCKFSEEAFTQLNQKLKIKVFFVANAFANEEVVEKLKSLGMGEAPLFWLGPSTLASNMDIVTTRNVINGFLKELKKDGSLLTAEEFSKLDKSKFINKTNQIGRIQGKNFIEKLVKENGLKHIKVPQKIAVVNKGLQSISFHIDCRLELIPKRDQLTIYAEHVKDVDRKLSLEEVIELMIILEKTGYDDLHRENFLFAEDGIYFSDTEYENFSPKRPQFNSIKNLKDLIDPKDAEIFLAEYEKRIEVYKKSEELRKAGEEESDIRSAYTTLVAGYLNHEFAFQLNSLST